MADEKEQTKEKTEMPVRAKRKLGTLGILGFFGLLIGILFLPTTIFLFVGMMPTIAAALTAGRGKRTKALTVGGMNFCGCFPFLLELWTADHSIMHALTLVADPHTIVFIYCAAGIGYLIDWAMGGIVSAVMIQRANLRLREIGKRQAELAERWGREVTGDMAVDDEGFPLEDRETMKKT